MATYVLKIKYENNVRRLTLPKEEVATKSFSFEYLVTRISELLQLPPVSRLAITYTDQENDVTTMGSDLDLKDALVDQKLNPLQIQVTLLDGAGMGSQERVDFKPSVFKRLGKELTSDEAFKLALQSCEPLAESCVKSDRDTVVQKLSPVKNDPSALKRFLDAVEPHQTKLPRGDNFRGFLADAGRSVAPEGVDSRSQTKASVASQAVLQTSLGDDSDEESMPDLENVSSKDSEGSNFGSSDDSDEDLEIDDDSNEDQIEEGPIRDQDKETSLWEKLFNLFFRSVFKL